MFVIPKAGLKVPDPERGDDLPETGREVSKNQYWSRRLNDVDVTTKQPPKPGKK
ncbi:DUF2635 domain-containing protein [Methylophaga sp.]|uniref:DUF2635 domain-containing protein n=1 Tax=Methylophaga sp. TaxID=2024840 RepID=UPI003A94885A